MSEIAKAQLLVRIDSLEQANRRWRLLAFVGMPFLIILFVVALVIATRREEEARHEADYLRLKLEGLREERGHEHKGLAVPDVHRAD
jgi:hypothetical protein